MVAALCSLFAETCLKNEGKVVNGSQTSSHSGINDPGDETLGEIDRLNVIDKDDEQLDDPEDLPLHTPPEELPDQDPAMAQPAPAVGVLPGQLTALPLFDCDRGEAFVNWLEVIENVEQTYGWTDQNILGVIRSKEGPKIADPAV